MSSDASRRIPLILTRTDGLSRLETWKSRVLEYGFTRNFDRGPLGEASTSVLSPWITTRLIREEEAVRAAICHHPFATVEKWIQEVCWRTYWKGWLEMRPGVWNRYRDDLSRIDPNGSIAATTGETGIACFDAWCRELLETGYLHNHVRMWFASIWIFTLQLPWQLGADFFFRHLADADAASNTLSWRWVAGLHTKGKHYVARAENIEKFTCGRFERVTGLNESPVPLTEDHDFDCTPIAANNPVPKHGRIGWLLHGEDGSFESFSKDIIRPVAVAGVFPRSALSRFWSDENLDRRTSALDDALTRASAKFDLPAPLLTDLASWARDLELDAVVTPRLPVGAWQDVLRPELANIPCPVIERTDTWDQTLWPHATRGYFHFKTRLPEVAANLMSPST